MLGATSPTLNHVSRDTSSIATSVRHRSPGPKTIAPIIPVPSTPITPSTTSSSILPRRTPPPAAPQPLGRAPPSQAPLPLSRLDPPPAAGPTSTPRPGPSPPAPPPPPPPPRPAAASRPNTTPPPRPLAAGPRRLPGASSTSALAPGQTPFDGAPSPRPRPLPPRGAGSPCPSSATCPVPRRRCSPPPTPSPPLWVRGGPRGCRTRRCSHRPQVGRELLLFSAVPVAENGHQRSCLGSLKAYT